MFYCILKGMAPEMKVKLGLGLASDYSYLTMVRISEDLLIYRVIVEILYKVRTGPTLF